MGAYINIGNDAFARVLNGEYVDKTGLIAEINGTLCSERQQYPAALKNYTGTILLCGISYDKDTKQHTCVIEKV